MSTKNITRITVGKHPAGIAGLNEAISVLSETYRERTDEEIGSAMLELLGKDNYIPSSAREEYSKAFAREFRKSNGQPYTEPAPEGMDIKVLGAGCDQCNKLEQMVMETLTELNARASLEHVTDMREIARYGVMGVPALLINGRVVSAGSVPPKNRLKSWIMDEISGSTEK
jgi:small redox-active disulfide protein 2